MRALLLTLAFAVTGAELRAATFPAPAVWPIRIEVSAENAAKLRTRPREYVPAKVRVLDHAAAEARLRLKGRGSFRPFDETPNFTIDFGKQPGPHGLEKIHLNNSLEDSTFLKERIGSEIFEAAGIPMPRVGHARVTLNGRALGLYVLKEGFTEDFIRRHFKSAEINLYDTDEGGDVDELMELDLGASPEQDELKRLAAGAKDPDLERRWSRLEAALDERFLTFMAVEIMIGHWDGYCLSGNNFRVLYDASRNKILFLPAGMDQIFAKADSPWKPPMAGLVAKSIFETGPGQARYETVFRKVFEQEFDASRLTNRISELVAGLEPFLERREATAIWFEARELCERIALREINLRGQLAEHEPRFPEFVNGAAALKDWQPFDAPEGGQLVKEGAALRMVAGPKTAASWRTTIRLKPGRYLFSGTVGARGIEPLPFGARHGATLRIIGRTEQSTAVLGTVQPKELRCAFEVGEEREVELACELRASQGEARFEGLRLEKEQ